MINKLRSVLDPGTKELLKHGKNYVSATVLVKVLAIVSIPIMTRLLTPADYGIIGVFSSFISILTIFYGIGFRGAVSRYYYEDTDEFGAFITTNIIFLWIWGMLLFTILYYNRLIVASWMNLTPNLIIWGGVTALLGATYEIAYSYLQASKQSDRISRVVIIRAVGSLFVTIPLTYFLKENRYLGSVYSQLFFSFLVFLFSLSVLRKVGCLTIKKKYLFYSLSFGIPVIFHLLSGYIMNNFDQVMINKMVGSAETGYYSFAYKVGMLFQLFITGMNQSWIPVFYQNLRDKNYEAINIIAKKYSIMVGGVALLLVIFAPLLVKLLASSAYYVALPIVPVIILGFIFLYFYFMYTGYAFYEKKTKSIAGVTVLSGLINIVLNYMFIPKFGYSIAAWTTVATYIVFFILSYMNIRFFIKPKRIISLKFIILPGGVAIVLIIGVMINIHYSNSLLIEVLIDIIIICLYCLSILFQERWVES